MKIILKNISILFFAFVIFNLFGCTSTSSQTHAIDQSSPDAKTLQESVQQMTTSIQPAPTSADFVEGPVPPADKNIIMYYYVQSGDTLTKIAKKIYGDSSAWQKLATINQLKNPNRIYAGDFIHYELAQPTKAFAEAYENTPRTQRIVKSGETLSHVAKAVYGNAADWRILWKENPQLKNPDKLLAGQVIYFRPKDMKEKQAVAEEMIEKPFPPSTEAVVDDQSIVPEFPLEVVPLEQSNMVND